MSYYGIDATSSSNFFESYFSTGNSTKKNNNSSDLSGLFASTAGSTLGDYSLLQSGAYKKLLKSYYKTVEGKDGKGGQAGETDSTQDMLNAKSAASKLKEVASGLVDNSKLFESVKDKDGKEVLDEDGNKTYDREGIKKAVKSFVEAYNAALDSSSELDNTSVLSTTLRMVKDMESHGSLLKSIGITIGEGNKLEIDEEKLDKANINDLKTIFNGRNSLASRVAQRASQIYNITNKGAYTNTRAATYTFDGTTSVMGNTTNYLNDLI